MLVNELRQNLVDLALEWERQYGVAPSIVSAISEYDAARLVGMSDLKYSSYMREQNRTAVSSGHDFCYKNIRYQIKAHRPSGKPGSKITNAGKISNDDEFLVIDHVSREVHHPYSDRPEDGIHVQSYCFEEVFEEKIRALTERLRPRDLYDVIHLYRHDSVKHDRAIILDTLEKKCAFKGISVPTMEILESKPERAELETEWENMLGHQVPVLPPFEQFWNELPEIFEWLYRAVEKAAPAAIPVGRQVIDTAWHPPTMATAWRTSIPLEPIRFAAANHLCVQLNYVDAKDNWKRPIIEPYSLRRTREGNLLLYAVKHETGEDRSYRIDRIRSAEVTKIPFTPKYAIELTPTGPISAPPISTKEREFGFAPSRLRSTSRRPRSVTSSYGPKYVFQCNSCGKNFTHKTQDPKLNKHKDKYGNPCPGRTGFLVDTKH